MIFSVFVNGNSHFGNRCFYFKDLYEVLQQGNGNSPVTDNELEKKAEFIEVKRNSAEINLGILQEKSHVFMRSTGELKDYRISYHGFSLKDM